MMPINIIQKLLKSPMAIFVYGILSKWYLMIAVAAMVVVFWVFKGLSDTGILKQAETTVLDALSQTKSVARFCVPKILNLESFWHCLQDPPEYPDEEEIEAIQKLHKESSVIDPDIYDSRNPYDYDDDHEK